MQNAEILKLLKRFAALCLLLLCGIGMACGVFMVRSNTRHMAFGEAGRQVGFSFDPEVTSITTGQRVLEWPSTSATLQWARLAPAPVGTLVMVIDSLIIAH